MTGAGSRTIASPSTLINRPFGVAYDPMRDQIVVANQDSNTLTFYPRTATGDIPPARTVTGLDSPHHVVMDPVHDQLFVVSGSAVLILDGASNGLAVPRMTIAGLTSPQGIGYDAVKDEIYVASSPSGTGTVAVYSRATGSAVRTISGATTGLNTDMVTTVAVDPVSHEIFIATFFPASVKVFAPLSGGGNFNVAPIRQIVGPRTGTFEPWFLAINPASPQPANPLFAAVLPASRSGRVGGNTLTAFASVTNADPTDTAFAVSIAISPTTAIPADFVYQQTNPLTNALIGSPNTPVDIPAGQTRSFVIAFTPTMPFGPLEVQLLIKGTNTDPVAPIIGVNTILLSADIGPVTDIVALAATIGSTGYVDIPGVSAIGIFAVATSNLGAAGLATVSGNTGATVLPITILVCETDGIGQCLAPPAAAVTLTMLENANHTFGFFVQGQGIAVADNAAINRVFAEFSVGGVVRGKTSVAVRTQ